MAVGAIGGAIYVNQQIPVVASEKSAVHNRFDLQNIAAAESANNKQKEVEEVRPTEENHEVDPDKEETKKEADQQKRRDKKQKREEEEQPDSNHHLDIKV